MITLFWTIIQNGGQCAFFLEEREPFGFFWRESFTQKTPEEDEGRVKEASLPLENILKRDEKNITDKNTVHIGLHKGHCLILRFSFTVCIHPILFYARRIRSTLTRLGRKPSVIFILQATTTTCSVFQNIFVANFSHFRSH